MNPITLALAAIAAYAAAGIVVAVAFVCAGIGRVDPLAADAPIGFRLLILPGAAALWPLLLAKWVSTARPGRSPAPAPPPMSSLVRLHARVWWLLGPLLLGTVVALTIPRPGLPAVSEADVKSAEIYR